MARTKKTEATDQAAEPVAAVEAAPAPAPAAAPAKASTYLVQWAIKFNGRRYAPGDRVELPADAAPLFLASGAVV